MNVFGSEGTEHDLAIFIWPLWIANEGFVGEADQELSLRVHSVPHRMEPPVVSHAATHLLQPQINVGRSGLVDLTAVNNKGLQSYEVRLGETIMARSKAPFFVNQAKAAGLLASFDPHRMDFLAGARGSANDKSFKVQGRQRVIHPARPTQGDQR